MQLGTLLTTITAFSHFWQPSRLSPTSDNHHDFLRLPTTITAFSHFWQPSQLSPTSDNHHDFLRLPTTVTTFSHFWQPPQLSTPATNNLTLIIISINVISRNMRRQILYTQNMDLLSVSSCHKAIEKCSNTAAVVTHRVPASVLRRKTRSWQAAWNTVWGSPYKRSWLVHSLFYDAIKKCKVSAVLTQGDHEE